MSLKDYLIDKSIHYNNRNLKLFGNNWRNGGIDKNGDFVMNKDNWNPKEGMPIVLRSRLSKDYKEIGEMVAAISSERIQKVMKKVLKQTLRGAVPFKGKATNKSYFVYKKRLTKMANFATWNVGYATGKTAKDLSEGATKYLRSVYNETNKTINVEYKIPPEVSLKLAPASKLMTIKGGQGLANALMKWIEAKNIYSKGNSKSFAWRIIGAWKKEGKLAIANEEALSVSRNPELKERFIYYLRKEAFNE
jgi:hypothetical protein